jgi:hypothetical protein
MPEIKILQWILPGAILLFMALILIKVWQADRRAKRKGTRQDLPSVSSQVPVKALMASLLNKETHGDPEAEHPEPTYNTRLWCHVRLSKDHKRHIKLMTKLLQESRQAYISRALNTYVGKQQKMIHRLSSESSGSERT